MLIARARYWQKYQARGSKMHSGPRSKCDILAAVRRMRRTVSRRAGTTTKQRARGLLAPTALTVLLLLCAGASGATPGSVRTVVVLTPDNAPGSPGSGDFYKGLRATFASDVRDQIQIRFEPLDISRFQDARGHALLADFLRQKYAGQKIDLVVAGLAPSLDFALEHRETIFPGVPIVFAALDRSEEHT